MNLHWRRRALLILLLLVGFIGTSVGYAIWDQSEIIDDTQIDLGDFAKIEINKTLDENVKLVPLNSFKGEGEVDVLYIDYQVLFNKEGRLQINIDPESIIVGDGNHNFNDLIIIQIIDETESSTLARQLELITDFDGVNEEDIFYKDIQLKLFIVAPDSSEDYSDAYTSLAGQSIKFSVTFEALELESVELNNS